MPRDALEPVYRLIASGRYIEAINNLNKLLKKQPDFLVAKIWKCEALYGLGNVVESENLMASIIDQSTNDKRTLESIADFYRARGNYAKLVEVYENALKHDPSDENWRKSLFECCGLSGDYKKQQQQALLLYKQCSRMLFYCMAVVCLLQQADENPLALELAERMMTKQADAGKIKSKNEILLLINVYERRKKFNEALELLEKSTLELDTLISTKEKKLELLMQLKRWPQAILLIKQILRQKPDGWNFYQNYLQAVLELEALGGTADDPDVEDCEDRAKIFLQEMIEEHPSLRGPFLAQLELVKLKMCDDNPAYQEKLLELIVSYFKRFGVKGISVFDLRSYIFLLPKSYHSKMINLINENNSELKSNLQLQKHLGFAKHISSLQVNMILRNYSTLSLEEREEICSDLMKCYKETASGDDRRDQYLVLQATLRKAMYCETGNAKHLLTIVCQLEEATLQGPCVFAVQVLLLYFYFALGATKAAKKVYEQLRIQSVQVDTLCHIFLANLSSTGHLTIAPDMWEHALRILQQCTAESLEALVWCYRAGLFHRVEEFTLCARRFQKTISVPLLRGEKAFLDVAMAEPSRAEQLLTRARLKFEWDSCVDNRDLNVLPSWDRLDNQDSGIESFKELLLYCKLRQAILCAVASAMVYGKDREGAEVKSYQQAIDDLQNLYSDAIAHRDLRLPNHTRLHLIVQKPFPTLIEKVMDFEVGSSEKVCAMLKQLSEDTCSVVSANSAKDPRQIQETIVTEFEMLAMLTAVCGVVRPATQAPQRKKNDPVVRSLLNSWKQLETCLIINPPDFPAGTPEAVQEIVGDKLRDSYLSCCDDIKKVIRKKTAYLNKLLNS